MIVSLLSVVLISCNNTNKPQQTAGPTEVNASAAEQEAIKRTLEYYVEGSRQGDSKITAKAFAEGATLSGIYEGQFSLAPIQVLYDLVDSHGPQETNYTLTTWSVEGGVAIVRIEAQFGTKKYTVMFTHVKDGSDWQITSKVYHLH